MSDIVSVLDGKVIARSTDVAARFGKRHDHVLRDIDRIVSDIESHSPSLGTEFFKVTHFRNARNREYREYVMTRDGFSLLVMGLEGKKALGWRLQYISAFNAMEAALTKGSESAIAMLGKAIEAMESDKAMASAFGKGLAEWKRQRKEHIAAIEDAKAKAQLILKF